MNPHPVGPTLSGFAGMEVCPPSRVLRCIGPDTAWWRRCPGGKDRIVHFDEGVGPDDPAEDAPQPPRDIVVVQSRRNADGSFAHSLGRSAMRLALSATNAGISTGRSLFRSALDSLPGQLVADIASGAVDALGRESGIDWDRAEQRVEEQLGRVVAVVAPVVVQSIDPDELLAALDVNALVSSIDLNALLEQVDVEALLARIDVDALLARVDVDGLLDRVDVDALLARVDVDELLDRVDVDALLARVVVNDLLARVDVDALLDRADVDAVVSRVDVNAVARRARIGELVAESSGDVAGSALDLGRRQAVALDTLLARSINRVLGREASTMPDGPPTLTNTEDAEQ